MSSQIKTEGCALFRECAEADIPPPPPSPARPHHPLHLPLLPPLARYIPAIAKMSLSGSGAHEKRPRLIFMCTDVINEREEGEEEDQEEEERIEWRTDLAELSARPCFITSTTARAQMRSNPFRFSSLRAGRTLPRVQISLRWDLFFPYLQGGFCTGLIL